MSLHGDIRTLAERLVGAGVPESQAWRLADLQTHALIRADRRRRAAELLPKIGAMDAALAEGCHRATIYRRVTQKVAFRATACDRLVG